MSQMSVIVVLAIYYYVIGVPTFPRVGPWMFIEFGWLLLQHANDILCLDATVGGKKRVSDDQTL